MSGGAATELVFDAFRLRAERAELLGPDGPVRLRAKTFSVLCLLAGSAGEVVTAAALQREVWEGVHVSPDTISTSIRELRRALGDSGRPSRFIETVHGRGYRFTVPVYRDGRLLTREGGATAYGLAGREELLGALEEALERARRGYRSAHLIAGPSGIGKSAVAEHFAGAVGVDGETCVGVGHCVDPRGAGEPYLPLMRVLVSMARNPGTDRLPEILASCAPHWLDQLPLLGTSADADHRVGQGFAPRMQREFLDVVDLLQRRRPVTQRFKKGALLPVTM